MTWHIPEGIGWVPGEDSGLWVLSPDAGEIFYLSDVSAEIWRAADGMGGDEDVVQELKERFDWPPGETRPHVKHFLAELFQRGLLKETAS